MKRLGALLLSSFIASCGSSVDSESSLKQNANEVTEVEASRGVSLIGQTTLRQRGRQTFDYPKRDFGDIDIGNGLKLAPKAEGKVQIPWGEATFSLDKIFALHGREPRTYQLEARMELRDVEIDAKYEYTLKGRIAGQNIRQTFPAISISGMKVSISAAFKVGLRLVQGNDGALTISANRLWNIEPNPAAANTFQIAGRDQLPESLIATVRVDNVVYTPPAFAALNARIAGRNIVNQENRTNIQNQYSAALRDILQNAINQNVAVFNQAFTSMRPAVITDYPARYMVSLALPPPPKQ